MRLAGIELQLGIYPCGMDFCALRNRDDCFAHDYQTPLMI